MKYKKQESKQNPGMIEIEAKTAAEAIKIALGKLGLDRSEADIKVLREENKGLFSMHGSKSAKVRVTKKLDKL
jgi:spoIIIJ-associated protein